MSTAGRRAPRLATVAAAIATCALAAPLAGAAVPVEPSALPGPEAAAPYAAGEAIVRFEPRTRPVQRRRARRAASVDFEEALDVPRTQLVEVEGSVRAAVRRLERQPGVEFAQPNYRYEALAEAPDDTFFGELWGLSPPPEFGVDALRAWDATRGAGQVIAILDTGVDLTHPDLAPNLWSNPEEAIGAEDGDENGKEDDVHGYDFIDEDGDPDEYHYHGTHVAGTAAAVADNELGIAGVAPEAETMAVRVLDGDGSGFSDDIADGIKYAAEEGAGTINLSLGGPAGPGDELVEDAVEVAAAHGAVVVVAAGNAGVDNDSEPHTPCALPQANLICVAAIDEAGELASFSNYGETTVDLGAPGLGILSAKVSYGDPLFTEGFEDALLSAWTAEATSGVFWGSSTTASVGERSATDSPGTVYAPESETFLYKTEPLDLASERGCRMRFDVRYEIQPPTEEEVPDLAAVGAISGEEFDGRGFAGSTEGEFQPTEASIAQLGGRSEVRPLFALFSDGSDQRDGIYVDALRLFCRDSTYADAISSFADLDKSASGSYIRFGGTSMATPHVAGVVALVRAAAPDVTLEEVVDAVLAGTRPLGSLEEKTVTGGTADAALAIEAATGEAIAPGEGGEEEGGGGEEGGEEEGTGEEDGGETASEPSGEEEEATPSQAAPLDRTPPETFFLRRSRRNVLTLFRHGAVALRLGSDEAPVRFVCRLDRRPLRFCGPGIFWRLPLGRHVLWVSARDAAGNIDRTPAVHRFRVVRVSRAVLRRIARRRAENRRAAQSVPRLRANDRLAFGR